MLRLHNALGLGGIGGGTPPTPAAPANTALPVISGTPSVGSTITTSNGSWTGFPSPAFTYQWQLGGVNIGGATTSSYTVQASDDDGLITCEVTATNTEGSAMAETAGVTATYPPANTVLPVISGTSEVGQTLTCSTGTWVGDGPITFSYQWQIDGGNVGTDQNTYVPVVGDIGGVPTCEVTATGADAPAATVETAGYTVVAAASGPSAGVFDTSTFDNAVYA